MEKMNKLVDVYLTHQGKVFSVTTKDHNQLINKLHIFQFETRKFMVDKNVIVAVTRILIHEQMNKNNCFLNSF